MSWCPFAVSSVGHRGGFSDAQQTWLRFYDEVEHGYYKGMHDWSIIYCVYGEEPMGGAAGWLYDHTIRHVFSLFTLIDDNRQSHRLSHGFLVFVLKHPAAQVYGYVRASVTVEE